MAGTIFDMPAPRAARSSLKYIGAHPEEKDIPSQAAEGEPEVECEPRLGKAVFNYLAPRKGVDAPSDFRSCASCANYVPERAFHAATTGNHCVLFGSFPVEPHAVCNFYHPWPDGKPEEHAVGAHALCCLAGARMSISPYEAGYCADRDHDHRCRYCRHYDALGDADSPGPECEFMEELNRKVANLFDVSEKIDPDGGCSAWCEPAPDESNPSGQEGKL